MRFDNRSGHALLAGPVDLIRGSGFSGRGTLDFTAPGAPAELAFGSCDDYRVVRQSEESRDSTGITQRTVVTRTIRLHLSRFSAPGEHDERVVVLRERIPVSEVSAVEIRLHKNSCSPAPDTVDTEGIARWNIPSRPAVAARSPWPTNCRRAPRSPGSEAGGRGDGPTVNRARPPEHLPSYGSGPAQARLNCARFAAG